MEEKRKILLFVFVFLTYLPVFLLKSRSGELQRVPTRHTFDGPRYPKNKKYLKKCDLPHHHFFSGISCFSGSGIHQKYVVWIPHPIISPDQNLSKNIGRYVKNTNTKSSFFHSSSKINNYYFIILAIILLF